MSLPIGWSSGNTAPESSLAIDSDIRRCPATAFSPVLGSPNSLLSLLSLQNSPLIVVSVRVLQRNRTNRKERIGRQRERFILRNWVTQWWRPDDSKI